MATPDNVVDIVTRHTYGTWRPQKGWRPLHVVRAEGSCFFDASGKRFLDMSAQLMCVNLGHGNPAVVEAICKQARELAFVAPGFATSIRAELATQAAQALRDTGHEAHALALDLADAASVRTCARSGKYRAGPETSTDSGSARGGTR